MKPLIVGRGETTSVACDTLGANGADILFSFLSCVLCTVRREQVSRDNTRLHYALRDCQIKKTVVCVLM